MENFSSKRYKIVDLLGEGSFGAVCEAVDKVKKTNVALKIEKNKGERKILHVEAEIYQAFNGAPEFPQYYGYSTENNFNILAMELMGPSLEDLLEESKEKKFSIKTILMLADQMIGCIEYVHKRGFAHRDIKPDNFCMGLDGNQNRVFLLDLGILHPCIKPSTGEHIKYKDGLSLCGTARYASINALAGIQQTRRDDLESLGYVFSYLFNGTLPWVSIKADANDAVKYDKIRESKERTKLDDLFKGMPPEFPKFMKLVKKLNYDEEPDYAKYKKMFRDAMIRLKLEYDSIFDWTDPKLYKKNKKHNKTSKNTYFRDAIDISDTISGLEISVPIPESPRKEKKKKDSLLLLENPDSNNVGVMIIPKMSNSGFKEYVPPKRGFAFNSKDREIKMDAPKAPPKEPTTEKTFIPPPAPPNPEGKVISRLDVNERLGGLRFD